MLLHKNPNTDITKKPTNTQKTPAKVNRQRNNQPISNPPNKQEIKAERKRLPGVLSAGGGCSPLLLLPGPLSKRELAGDGLAVEIQIRLIWTLISQHQSTLHRLRQHTVQRYPKGYPWEPGPQTGFNWGQTAVPGLGLVGKGSLGGSGEGKAENEGNAACTRKFQENSSFQAWETSAMELNVSLILQRGCGIWMWVCEGWCELNRNSWGS